MRKYRAPSLSIKIINLEEAVMVPQINIARTTAIVSSSPKTVSLSCTSSEDKLANGDKKPNHSTRLPLSPNNTAPWPDPDFGSKLASVKKIKCSLNIQINGTQLSLKLEHQYQLDKHQGPTEPPTDGKDGNTAPGAEPGTGGGSGVQAQDPTGRVIPTSWRSKLLLMRWN